MKSLRLVRVICALIVPAAGAVEFEAGFGRQDVTPQHPVRLSGYAARTGESEGVEQSLWAKAMALRSGGNTAVLVAVDNCAVPRWMREALAGRLQEKANLPAAYLAVASTHTHTAPCLKGALANLFVADLPEDQLERIERYSNSLLDGMEAAALEALSDLQPAEVVLGHGTAGFAGNRRTAGGPVDHSVPVLGIRGATGKWRGVVGTYACHCTTMTHLLNKSCGDWAGYAAEYIETAFEGATALITIGCGADANPQPRGSLDLAKAYGRELATAVERVLAGELRAVGGGIVSRFKEIDLPFERLPSREQWEARAKEPGIVGYHARKNIERLDRGEALPEMLRYPVQVWSIGNDLAWIFLGGEVVVDYALSLKKSWDRSRLIVTAYANDVPCYIPSKRILAEGGYEAESSLLYYGQPARLKPVIEERILETISALMPPAFAAEL